MILVTLKCIILQELNLGILYVDEISPNFSNFMNLWIDVIMQPDLACKY